MKYILAADDEPFNLLLLAEVLTDEYEVKCVEDGRECLESLGKRTPDLVLLDVAMPGVNGLDVCKKIKTDDKYSNIPVIMLSGFASKKDIEKGLAAGADSYITKPFKPETLREEIRKRLVD